MERSPGRPQEAPGDPQEASKRLQSCPQEASTHRKPNQARRNARSDPPPISGRRAGCARQGLQGFLQTFLDQVFELKGSWAFFFLNPSLILPRRPAHSAGPTFWVRGFSSVGASWPEKWRSKRPSKNDQILMPFQHRFWSVLAPFWEAKMVPKSIKNPSILNFRAFLFRHRFLY